MNDTLPKKLIHLQLEKKKQGEANVKTTLICRLYNGEISYVMFDGWGASGRVIHIDPKADLPIENMGEETVESFQRRIIKAVHDNTDWSIEHEVNTFVKFKINQP